MNGIDDYEILAGLKNRDKKLVKFLYTNSYKQIKKFILSYGGSEADAQDVFQEIVMVLYLKSKEKGFRLSSSLNTYLFGIGKNIWFRKYKREQIYSKNEDLKHYADDDDLIEKINEAEIRNLIIQYLNTLKEECKKMMRLILEGKSLEEVQIEMNYNSIQYTKNRKLHCKTLLMEKIMSDPNFKNYYDEQN